MSTEKGGSPRGCLTRAWNSFCILCAVLSITVCILLSALYAIRPAGADPLTVWPFWTWALPTAWLGLFGLSPGTRRWGLVALGLWVVAGLTIPEEPRAMLRGVQHRFSRRTASEAAVARTVRVVSINCGGGSLAAAEEAVAQNADIILLQESPGRTELNEWASRHSGWGVAYGIDASVLARGAVRSLPVVGSEGFMCMAYVKPDRLKPATRMLVLSTRLGHPMLRSDFWRPATWAEAGVAREGRVQAMAQLASRVADHVRAMPVIAGGDFNTPGGDSLFRPLKPYLRDAFAVAGVGWPNTITNEYPMSRIDQIWVSEHFSVSTLRAIRTQNSDHRMVVADLMLRPRPTDAAAPKGPAHTP